MMEDKDLSELYRRFLNNQASDLEVLSLMKKFGTMDEQALKELVQHEIGSEIDNSPLSAEGEQAVHRVFQHITQQIKPRPHIFRRYLPYAAAAIVLISCSIYFFAGIEPEVSIGAPLAEVDLSPGYNQAVLTLADGRTVSLDSAQRGIIVSDDGVSYTNGVPVLNERVIALGEKETDQAISTALHTIRTPRGGQYQVTLPDGSVVWLNAATTLKYPNSFTNNRREVEVEGEAYFKILRNPDAPFVVKSLGQEVMVMGTEFNVAAYREDTFVKTTLVSGSIHVRAHTSAQRSAQLKPGEQSILSKKGVLSTSRVNLESEIAWKTGLISFSNVRFEDLMQQLERWYNIDVVYEGRVPEVYFEGAITRDVNLNILLEFLKDSDVDFTVTAERKLIIREMNKM